jgi:hypothetical protein
MEVLVFIEKLLNMISGFISVPISWSVVVLVVFLLFMKPIKKILKKLTAIEITKDGSNIKLIFKYLKNELDKVDKVEKEKNQTTSYPIGMQENSDSLKLEILRIYAEIETAFKKKFGVPNGFNVFAFLYNEKKVNSDILIILSSMELLRDEILSSAVSPKMNREYIETYRFNADRIKNIIQKIDAATVPINQIS